MPPSASSGHVNNVHTNVYPINSINSSSDNSESQSERSSTLNSSDDSSRKITKDNTSKTSSSFISNDSSYFLKCLYTNCDSILNKVSEFESIVQSENPHIIFLSETKLCSDIINVEIFMCNTYEVYRLDRTPADGGGGVCILVRKDITSIQLDSSFFIDGCECVSCIIKLGPKSILACCMYRPPSYTRDMNANFFDQIKLQCRANCDQLLICGDFNFGNIDWETHNIAPGSSSDTQCFYDCIQDCFLEQHVRQPTRKRGHHDPSTLDLIFTKTEHEVGTIE